MFRNWWTNLSSHSENAFHTKRERLDLLKGWKGWLLTIGFAYIVGRHAYVGLQEIGYSAGAAYELAHVPFLMSGALALAVWYGWSLQADLRSLRREIGSSRPKISA